MTPFKALIVTKEDEQTKLSYEMKDESFIKGGEVLFKVLYSSINYKDYLATIKTGNVAKIYPLIPGIDAVGEVISDDSKTFKERDLIIVSGKSFGVSRHGGYSQYARAHKDEVYLLPKGMSEEFAAIMGTAGFTAMQSILALKKHGMLDVNASILVTGATGGVGSTAVYLLKQMGYKQVIAMSRKEEHHDWLTQLGASSVITPQTILDKPYKPLNVQTYDFILDSVGGEVAAKLLPYLRYGGSMTMCGHTSGTEFNTTVFPMILRGINILGIDSVGLTYDQKKAIWNQMAEVKQGQGLELLKHEIYFDGLKHHLEHFGSFNHIGRTVVSFK
jgi:acrylyl-CoA reductase (NADPH)